ncbi:DUF3829 domain-containing protein [Leminorella grimontii]|uniref:DUF3829 domain-containing protein n=1 Tax=Leminorella grimontii TaxID=82981 RepID=UPI0020803E3B|nr:DUF3829 domain-containing protein [Leminorella grimontii]GKX61102.1 hypothetical protein SOASR031_34170 [Leminorella grimontii]
MNKLSMTILASLIAGLLVGCDGKEKDAPAADAQKQPQTVQTVQTAQTAPSPAQAKPKATESAPAKISAEEEASQAAQKGNLWLDVFNNSSSIKVNGEDGKQIGGLIQFTKISQASNYAEKYMDIAENNGKFTLKKIRKQENTLDPFFTMKSFYTLGKVSDSEIQNYQKVGEALSNMKPPMPELDKAGVAYMNSIINIAKASNAMYDYYVTSEEYKLDDFKKAPELHKVMAEAYKQYEAANEVAHTAHNNLYKEFHQKELEIMKSKGFDTTVIVYTSVDDVSDFFGGLVDIYNANKGSLKKADKAFYEGKSKRIEEALEALKKAKENAEGLAKEGLKEGELNSYIERLNAFSISAKVTLRDMGKSKDHSLLNDLQNKQENVTSAYNRIVMK